MNRQYFKNLLPSMTLLLVTLIALYLLLPGVSIQINRGLSMLKLHDALGLSIQYSSLSWAAVLSLLIAGLQVILVPLPVSTAAIASVQVFGWAYGFILVWLGVITGAGIMYAVARTYITPLVARLIKPQKLHYFLQHYGIALVIAGSLFPIWPGKLVYFIAGLGAMSFGRFLTAMVLGSLPLLIVYSVLGEQPDIRVIYLLYIVASLIVAYVLIKAWLDRSR